MPELEPEPLNEKEQGVLNSEHFPCYHFHLSQESPLPLVLAGDACLFYRGTSAASCPELVGV